MAALPVLMMSGCEEYNPVNMARTTETLGSNSLTTVTTIETTRADTYSEYISSLRASESESLLAAEQSDMMGIVPETPFFVSEIPITLPSMDSGVPDVTGITLPQNDETSAVSDVTLPENNENTSVTSITFPPEDDDIFYTETMPPFILEDIPPVPGSDVRHSD